MMDNVLAISVRMSGQQSVAAGSRTIRGEIGAITADMKRQASEQRRAIIDQRRSIIDLAAGIATPLAVASGAITAFTGLAAREAAGFTQGMRNWNSVALQSEQTFRKMGKSVLDLLSDPLLNKAPADLARGLYAIESQGIKGDLTLKAMKLSSQGAAAGMTDLFTVARPFVGLMNAYGQTTGPQAARTMDILFKIVQDGAPTMEELASQIGPVGAAAARTGVPLEEVGAALVVMTNKAIPTAEACTSLERIMTTLADAPKELTRYVHDLGYESTYAWVQMRGLGGVVEDLNRDVGDAPDKLAQMGFEMRALRFVMALTGESAEPFRRKIEDMCNASGAMLKSLGEQAKGTEFQWQRTTAMVQRSLTELGQALEPEIKAAMGMVQGLNEEWHRLPAGVKEVVAVTLLATGAVAGLTAGEVLLRTGIMRAQIAIYELNYLKKQAAMASGEVAIAETGETAARGRNMAAIVAETGAMKAQAAWAPAMGARGYTAGGSMLLGEAEVAMRQGLVPPQLGRGLAGTGAAIAGGMTGAEMRAAEIAAPAMLVQGMAGKGFGPLAMGEAAPGLAARAWAGANRPISELVGAGAGAGTLTTIAPGMAAVVGNPVTWLAAGAAATFYWEKKAVIGRAIDRMEEGQRAELEAGAKAVAAGGAYTYGVHPVDMAAAGRYRPGFFERGVLAQMLGTTEQMEDVRYAQRFPMGSKERERMEQKFRKRGPEALAWFRSQMPERVGPTFAAAPVKPAPAAGTPEATAAGAQAEIDRIIAEQQGKVQQAGYLAEARRLRPDLFPEKGGGREFSVNLYQHLQVNDRREVGAIAQREVDQAFDYGQ